MSQMIRSNSTQSRFPFSPPARLEEPCSKHQAEDHEDNAAALEVARRSSWYREPPQVLPRDVPVIEVSTDLKIREIKRMPSRPRTSQPSMLIRPQTAPAAPESSSMPEPRTTMVP